MENKNYYDEVGWPLTSGDINHLDNTLLTPASSRCRRTNINNEYVFGKELRTPILIEGVKYYPRFSSERNNKTGMWEYHVGLDSIEDTSMNKLSGDERHGLILQFHRMYVDGMEELPEVNDEWKALVTTDTHSNIGVRVASIQEYVFANQKAQKYFAVEQSMTVGYRATTRRELGRHSLRDGFDDPMVSLWRSKLAAEVIEKPTSPIEDQEKLDLIINEVVALEKTAEDYCAVTTDDVRNVVSILKMLDLVTPNDEKRFNLGRR